MRSTTELGDAADVTARGRSDVSDMSSLTGYPLSTTGLLRAGGEVGPDATDEVSSEVVPTMRAARCPLACPLTAGLPSARDSATEADGDVTPPSNCGTAFRVPRRAKLAGCELTPSSELFRDEVGELDAGGVFE